MPADGRWDLTGRLEGSLKLMKLFYRRAGEFY